MYSGEKIKASRPTGGSSFVGENADLSLKFRDSRLGALGEFLEKGGDIGTTGRAALVEARPRRMLGCIHGRGHPVRIENFRSLSPASGRFCGSNSMIDWEEQQIEERDTRDNALGANEQPRSASRDRMTKRSIWEIF